MALNQKYSVNDLERVKFRPDATSENSVIQTYEMNQVDQQINTSHLHDILEELRKMNFYLAIITNVKI